MRELAPGLRFFSVAREGTQMLNEVGTMDSSFTAEAVIRARSCKIKGRHRPRRVSPGSPMIVSEDVQFVRNLSRDCVFPVIGYDEFVGAEDPQHRIIYPLLQAQRS